MTYRRLVIVDWVALLALGVLAIIPGWWHNPVGLEVVIPTAFAGGLMGGFAGSGAVVLYFDWLDRRSGVPR